MQMTANSSFKVTPLALVAASASHVPEHGTDNEILIKNADAAMYSAKESGRNNFRFFTEDMNAQGVERLTLENGLDWHSTRKNSFSCITAGDIVRKDHRTEALLRWQHPTWALCPDKFIRIAENCGLIVPLGDGYSDCSLKPKWQTRGFPQCR